MLSIKSFTKISKSSGFSKLLFADEGGGLTGAEDDVIELDAISGDGDNAAVLVKDSIIELIVLCL